MTKSKSQVGKVYTDCRRMDCFKAGRHIKGCEAYGEDYPPYRTGMTNNISKSKSQVGIHSKKMTTGKMTEDYQRAVDEMNRFQEKCKISDATKYIQEVISCSFDCKNCENLLDKKWDGVRKMKEDYKKKWGEDCK